MIRAVLVAGMSLLVGHIVHSAGGPWWLAFALGGCIAVAVLQQP